jgi:hypothetical protein
MFFAPSGKDPTMRKYLILLATVILAMPVATFALPAFTGSLTTPSGVYATNPWDAAHVGFKIEWTVSQQLNGDWFYDYRLTNAAGGELEKRPSHLILEISDNAAVADFWNFKLDATSVSEWEIDTFSSANPSNPQMPGPLYAVKINTPDGYAGNFHYTFYSERAPTWGDFYVKDGKESQQDVVAWDTDFLVADPTAAAQNGLLTDLAGRPVYKILRPDTQTTIVPEPTTVLLLGLGLSGFGLLRRKKS